MWGWYGQNVLKNLLYILNILMAKFLNLSSIPLLDFVVNLLAFLSNDAKALPIAVRDFLMPSLNISVHRKFERYYIKTFNNA